MNKALTHLSYTFGMQVIYLAISVVLVTPTGFEPVTLRLGI